LVVYHHKFLVVRVKTQGIRERREGERRGRREEEGRRKGAAGGRRKEGGGMRTSMPPMKATWLSITTNFW
jgi:hypothetical protein